VINAEYTYLLYANTPVAIYHIYTLSSFVTTYSFKFTCTQIAYKAAESISATATNHVTLQTSPVAISTHRFLIWQINSIDIIVCYSLFIEISGKGPAVATNMLHDTEFSIIYDNKTNIQT